MRLLVKENALRTIGAVDEPEDVQQAGPTRVLVMMDHRVLAEMVNLTLNHGLFVTRGAKDIG